jgi:ubiquitin C-terminal hydrolase
MTSQLSAASLKCLDPIFGPFSSTRHPITQEDSIQFLMYFLNLLHEELLSLIGKLADEVPKGGWKTQGKNRGHIKLQETQGRESPLTDIFSTKVHSDTRQNGCSRTVSRESFLVLPLSISGIRTIEEAIDAFVREEKIEESVTKQNSFSCFPKSLIIGLKRFTFDANAGYSVKLHDVVAYPDVLTMPVLSGGVAQRYQLCAVVEHLGKSPDGGHYVCYARRFDGTWMKFDDDRVMKISSEGHLDLQAYLLLYNQITSAQTP